MRLRRNSVIKRILCYVRRYVTRTHCVKWRWIADIEEHYLIIYECEICGYLDIIDYKREAE